MNIFVAQLRREIWEHPVLYIAPIVIGGILFVLTGLMLIGDAGSAQGIQIMTHDLDLTDARYGDAGMTIALMSFLPAFLLPLIVIIGFYLLDSLSTERRDGSILFFKSLPVSDTATVLSKLVTASVVAPALTLAALIVTQLAVLSLASVAFALGNGGVAMLWDISRIMSVWTLTIYGAVAFGLWFAPIHCYFLAVSAWARRATLVWAASPLLLILVERALTGRTLLGQLLGAYVGGFLSTAFAHRFRVTIGDDDEISQALEHTDLETMATVWDWMDPVGLLTSPALWIGLVVAAGFGTGTVMLRRYRDDS